MYGNNIEVQWFFYEAILPELLGKYFSNRPIEQTRIEEDILDRLASLSGQ